MAHQDILNKIEIEAPVNSYWDVRIEETFKTEIKYEDYELIGCSTKPSLGAFIRVYQNGMWFYASTTQLDQISEQIRELYEKAKSFPNKETTIKPYNTQSFHKELILSEAERLDQVSIAAKKQICESYFEQVKGFEQLKGVRVNYVDEYKLKHFRSSTDVRYSYDFNQCGLMISYTATDGKDQFEDAVRFYGHKIDDLKDHKVTSQIEESLLFVNAKKVDAGEYPVVMDSEVVGVFAHESFGHKSEADFMIGDEEAKETWKIGKKVGNECLSIVDCGTEIGTSGYCPFDDEGFPTQKTYLIKDGLLTGRLHSQQTAQLLDEAPTGNGRAMNFEFEPIVRMTNTYVEPGEKTLEELISDVKFGVYAKDMNHGSGLSTFTIAPRKCYAIRDGKIAEPVRVSVMSGSVFEALGDIQGCAKDSEIISSAFGGCGKMEQWPLPVGFGGSKVLISKLVIS